MYCSAQASPPYLPWISTNLSWPIVTIVKIGLPTRRLSKTFRRALTIAAQLEADGVELDLRTEVPLADLSQTGIRQLRKLLEDANLRVAAVRYPTRRGYDSSAEIERRLQGTCQAMQVAAKLGARVLVGQCCEHVPTDDQPGHEVLLQSLEVLAREGNRLGVRFASLCGQNTPAELATLLAKLPEGTVAAALDPAGLVAEGQDVAGAIEQLGPYIDYVVAGDAVREFGSGRSVPVELGRGSVEWPEVMALLDAYGYQGWATVDLPGASDPETVYGNAVAFLRQLQM